MAAMFIHRHYFLQKESILELYCAVLLYGKFVTILWCSELWVKIEK